MGDSAVLNPPTNTLAKVLCCVCGALVDPTPGGMCISCLRETVDITKDVCRSFVVDFCKRCRRYKDFQGKWILVERESKELLSLCLKKIKGLKTLSCIEDTKWLYTEPNSKTVQIRISARGEVLDGKAQLKQNFNVNGVVHHAQCDDCRMSFTPHSGWGAQVQLRQRATHKRTFLYLEQLILKHGYTQKLLSVLERPDGLDLRFSAKQHAQQFSDFVISRFPCEVKQSKKLIAHDMSSNKFNYKYTVNVNICSVCKDDLVFIPKHINQFIYGGGKTKTGINEKSTVLQKQCSNIYLCSNISAYVTIMNPFTGVEMQISTLKYFQHPFKSICTRQHLSIFMVLSVTLIDNKQLPSETHKPKITSTKKHKRKIQKTRRNMHRDEFSDEEVSQNESVSCYDMEVDGGDNQKTSNASRQNKSDTCDMYEFVLLRVSKNDIDHVLSERKYHTISHLGKFIACGDYVQAYDLRTINLSGFDDELIDADSSGNFQEGRKDRFLNSAQDDDMMQMDSNETKDIITLQAEAAAREAATLNKEENEGIGLAGLGYDAIIVNKFYPRNRASNYWTLRTIQKQQDMDDEASEMEYKKRRGGKASDSRKGYSTMERDMQDFRDEIEENPEMRKNIELWKDPSCVDMPANAIGDDSHHIALTELMDGLSLDDVNKQVKLGQDDDADIL